MTNQKNKRFLSLNAKIFLVLFLSIAGICSLFLSTFMISYVRQLDQESVISRKKAEALFDLYEENIRLRNAVSKLYARLNTPETDSITRLWNDQDDDYQMRSLDDRQLSIRKELMQDIKGVGDRDRKMRELGYFILSGFLLVFFILEMLWLIVRRWVLRPVADLLDATRRISSGDLGVRISVAPRLSKQDELDLLARDFNSMADNIERSIQNLEENKELLQSLIDTIPDGIRVLDENCDIMMTNRSYGALFDASAKKCYALFGRDTPCASGLSPCPLVLLRENGGVPVNVIQRYTDKEGRDRFMEVTAAAFHHKSDEKPVMWIVEQIRPLDKAILFSHQQKLSSVGMLASSVAHEMRNPLGSVRLILENILDKMDTKPMKPDDLKRYLRLVNEQIGFCINVTSRLLKLSRKPEKEYKPVDMNEVVSETACLLEYEAKKTGIDIQIVESDRPAVVFAADAEMRMVTVNLMQNAFHAMPDGGNMCISIVADDENVTVDFTDTGIGISPANLTRIFEPFFSESVQNGENTGTGLGLAIVKTIIENGGGEISVESEIGRGTVFHLKFKAYRPTMSERG